MRMIALVILSVGLTLAPLSAEAQPTPARLAMLLTGQRADSTPEYAAFMKQLGDLGWIEGQNLAVDRRSAIASTDPRVLGVASLAHPGGNLTGLTIGQPKVTSENRLGASVEMMAAAARVLGFRLQHLDVLW